MTTDERLTSDELAAETGTVRAHLDELVAAGILRPAADGSFSLGDVQRVLVADALVEAGLSVEAMRGGIEAGVVSFEDTDVIYASPGRRGPSVDDLAAEVGIETEVLLRIITAFGMSRPDATSRLYEADAEQLRAFVAAWRDLGDDDLLVRAARAYGDALRRAAESWLGLFEDVVMAPLAGRAVPWEEMRSRAAAPGMRLLEVGRAMLPWLLDRHLFDLLNQLNLGSIERQLAILGIVPAAPRAPAAIVFTDLTGFTGLTEAQGDEVAAAIATDLAVIADEVAQRHGGRLVKLLGDGVMLYFPRPADAVAAAMELRLAMSPAGLPPAHTGIAAGAVIRRGSDFYGRTVNIASRLAAAAAPGEILVSDDLVGIVSASGNELPGMEALPLLELKGIPEPVRAHRVTERQL
jgi:adenylate cyclase